MKDIEKTYANGEIIFQEGDISSTAFVISSGQVELLKNSPNSSYGGPIRLELLSAGSIIGAMGILDRSARTTTAKAVGTVTLDVIEHEEFLSSIKEKPDVALSVIGNLAERLRNSNEMAVHSNSLNIPMQASKIATLSVNPSKGSNGQSSLWDAIRNLFSKSPNRRRLLEFRVARLSGDKDGIQTNLLVRALSDRPELNVKAYNEPLPIESSGYRAGAFLQSALIIGRRWLANDKADLLIWGDVNEVSITLFTRL